MDLSYVFKTSPAVTKAFSISSEDTDTFKSDLSPSRLIKRFGRRVNLHLSPKEYLSTVSSPDE